MYKITCTTYRKDGSIVDSFVINYGAALEELGDQAFHHLLTSPSRNVTVYGNDDAYKYEYTAN